MAEEITTAPATIVETSPMAEETTASPNESTPIDTPTDAPPNEEEKAKETASEPPETEEVAPSVSDHKRKVEDLENDGDKKEGEGGGEASEKDENEGKILEAADDTASDSKRQRLDDGVVDGLGVDAGQDVQKEVVLVVGNGQLSRPENFEAEPVKIVQDSTEDGSEPGNLSLADRLETSRQIEILHDKVGVLIGKAGETIRLLQNNSGARIRITRDADADLNYPTRSVELTGSVENINKAEQLIKNVIAEAEAGGSPALAACGFGGKQAGSEVCEMQVPNEKVGWIIGKGGETIKSIQTKSHARIQLIPQHLPEGDFSKERTVQITGSKKEIEDAKNMIKDAMKQTRRPSNLSAGHGQGYRPRGPTATSQWGTHGQLPTQSQMQPNPGYGYPQKGAYPPQPTQQYPQQSYVSGYPQQPPPRNNWEPAQTYYEQGGHMTAGMGNQPSNPVSAQNPAAPVNYSNYGQPPPAAGYYGQSNPPYSQNAPTQQSYGHDGYNEVPKYDNQAPPNQQMYGQQPVSSQPGFYPQQGSTTSQSGYAQQTPYGKPEAYSVAPPQSSYGPPARVTQPGDPAYQGQVPSQQSYPYGSSSIAPSPQQPGSSAYSQNYNQTTPSGGYSQPSAQVAPGYGQGMQPVPAYTQPGAQSGPNVNYGYQGGADAGYGGYSAPPVNSGYGAAPAAVGAQTGGYGQPAGGGYAQPPVATYDQPSMAPPPMAGGYGSSNPPAVGYAGQQQYDMAAPVYGHH